MSIRLTPYVGFWRILGIGIVAIGMYGIGACSDPVDTESVNPEWGTVSGAAAAVPNAALCDGPKGLVCPNGMTCKHREGQCDDLVYYGLCVPLPTVCPTLWEPVCGCDGKTYANSCVALLEGMTVKHKGECKDMCKLGVASDCTKGEFCDPISCEGSMGYCVPYPVAPCPRLWAPVCGCDGKTYPNDCQRIKAGQGKAHNGICPNICGPTLPNMCPKSQFCSYPPGTCDNPGQTGVCANYPTACPDVWKPVCGCDGVTYSNVCDMAQAGMSMDHEGVCCPAPPVCDEGLEAVDTDGDGCVDTCLLPCAETCECYDANLPYATPCPMLCPTCDDYWTCTGGYCVEGCGPVPPESAACLPQPCKGNLDCPKSEFCLKDGCDAPYGVCQTRPLICPDVWNPVCSCTGVTHANACYAHENGENIKHNGVCEVVDPCAPQDAMGIGLCDLHLGAFWNGTTCVNVSGCVCVGADCGFGFPNITECLEAYKPCWSCDIVCMVGQIGIDTDGDGCNDQCIAGPLYCAEAKFGQCKGFDYTSQCNPKGYDCGPDAILADPNCDGEYEVCLLCPDGTHAVDKNGDGCEEACDCCPMILCPKGTIPVDTNGDGCDDFCKPQSVYCDKAIFGQCPGFDYTAQCNLMGYECGPNGIFGDINCDGTYEVCFECPEGTHAVDYDGDGCEEACDCCPPLVCPDGTIPKDTDGDGCGDTCKPEFVYCDKAKFGQCPGFDYSDQCNPLGYDCAPFAIFGDLDCDGQYEVCLLCPEGTHPVDYDGDGCEEACDCCKSLLCPTNTIPIDTDGDGCNDFCKAIPCDKAVFGQCEGFDYTKQCDPTGPDCGTDAIFGDSDCDGQYDVCILCPFGTTPKDLDQDGCEEVCDCCPSFICPKGTTPTDTNQDQCPDICVPCLIEIECMPGFVSVDKNGDGCVDGCVCPPINCPTSGTMPVDTNADLCPDACPIPGVKPATK